MSIDFKCNGSPRGFLEKNKKMKVVVAVLRFQIKKE